MSFPANPDELLNRAGDGDRHAVEELFHQQRLRLRSMIAARMDPILSSRIGPSDVVQEAFIEAHRQLDDYLKQRPIPFYPSEAVLNCPNGDTDVSPDDKVVVLSGLENLASFTLPDLKPITKVVSGGGNRQRIWPRGQLAVWGQAKTAFVFDVTALRKGLQSLGLDW